MTQNDYQELMKEGYSRGYQAWEHSFAELIDIMRDAENPQELWLNGDEDNYPFSDIITEDIDYNKAIWWIEDQLNIEEGDGWGDNYGYIEDFHISYEAGAYDSIMNNEYNPQRVPFIEPENGE